MKLEAWLVLSLLGATGLKIALVLGDKIPFNSDEAIVALMGRHILQGERPLFFYGQAYMGSLDAWLVASAFQLFGENVFSIRLIQILLYCGFILTLALLARRLFTDDRAVIFSVLLAAVPGVLVTTYTTASLGGYGETLVFGNLILLLGYEVVYGKYQEAPAAWAGLGLIAGVAFWTLGMSGIYLLPVALLGLFRFRAKRIPFYALAAGGFLLGSSPWWYYNLIHDWDALSAVGGDAVVQSALLDRSMGFLLIGLPTLIEIRFPWAGNLGPAPILFCGVLLFLGTISFLAIGIRKRILPIHSGALNLFGIFLLVWLVFFIGTRYGFDATGRYLLPLYIPLVLVQGCMVLAVFQYKQIMGWGLLLFILGFNGFNIGRAALSPDKLTTQFDPITCFDNSYDQELIEFLKTEDELRGYSNYWVSFRIAFLTGEQVVFAPQLPDKRDLSYTSRYNRIPGYLEAVENSSKVAYITTKHPALDQKLRDGFTHSRVSFSEEQIGPYHVFYDLSRVVNPVELGFGISTAN